MKKILRNVSLGLVLIMLCQLFASIPSHAEEICGDLNGDGSVNSIDFAYLRMYLLGINTPTVSDWEKSADLYKDGNVDAMDFAIFRKYMLGMIKSLPYIPDQPTTTPTPQPTNVFVSTLPTIPAQTPTAVSTPSPTTGISPTPTYIYRYNVGTWANSIQPIGEEYMPPIDLANNTLRQVFRVSIGGNKASLNFSNQYGDSPLTMKSVHLALSSGKGSIKSETDKVLTFNGKESVTIEAGKTIYSDTIDFDVPQLSNIAVTIYFGSVPSSLSGHICSLSTSYIAEGNKVSSLNMASAATVDHWYFISEMNLLKDETQGSYSPIVVLGNDNVDGIGLEPNQNTRWTDFFAERLLSNPDTSFRSVLNHGIGGRSLWSDIEPDQYERFQRVRSKRYLILHFGDNEILSHTHLSYNEIVFHLSNTIKQYRNMSSVTRIYATTIPPMYGGAYDWWRYSANDWIRETSLLDGVIDFDAAVRDPNKPEALLDIYSDDGFHLNEKGHKKLADSIDLAIFK